MAHVQKGAIGFKIDASQNVRIVDSYVDELRNIGTEGSMRCGDYEFSHPLSIIPFYQGANARGFSFAGSTSVQVQRCSVTNVYSANGNAYGFDVFTDSTDIDIFNSDVVALHAPTGNATAFHLGGSTTYSNLQNYCAAYIRAGEVALDVWDEDGVRNTVRNNKCR